MRRKPEEQSHGGMERWLLTYADMITLLMAFFIMMYSMSVLNVAKFREAAISIRSGFGGMIKGQGKSVLGSSGMFGVKPSPIKGDTAGVSWRVLRPLVEHIDTGKDEASVQIGETKRGIVITMSSDLLLFAPGSARLNPRALPLMDRIAAMLKQTANAVRVEGHTCDLPPRGSGFPTNWELSTARATEVLRYLVEENGLPALRFAAAGYAGVRPKSPNTTEANRSRNRRVEIVILRPEAALAEVEPAAGPRRISDPNISVIQRRLD
jgi:chemotaxis protein MotB